MASVSPPSAPLFACVIPGRPIDTNFQPVDSKKMVLTLLQPALISEFTICLLQPTLPQGAGVAVYYSLPPFNEWQYCGPVLLTHPTAAFRSPWYNKIPADLPLLQLGLSLESIDQLKQQSGTDQSENELALESASGIAKNLYEYMASFTQSTGAYSQPSPDLLVIPTNCIEKWYEKFKSKHRLEPYFWMKKDILKRY